MMRCRLKYHYRVGQGAVGIECRLDDTRTRELLAALNHPETALRVTAERAMNTRLEGGLSGADW